MCRVRYSKKRLNASHFYVPTIRDQSKYFVRIIPSDTNRNATYILNVSTQIVKMSKMLRVG